MHSGLILIFVTTFSGATLTWFGALLGICSPSAIWPAGIIGGIIGATGYYVKQNVINVLSNRTHTIRNKIEKMARDVGDIHGVVRIAPYTQRLPLTLGGGWAMTGDALALLTREAIIRKPKIVVEFGSGASTLVLGQIVASYGGQVFSFDHDSAWADRTRKQIQALDLGSCVKVFHAPLTDLDLDSSKTDWYNAPSIMQLGLEKIDFLVVDGPPKSSGKIYARFPALPFMSAKLTADALIFVDDAKREEEKNMVTEWINRYPEWQAEFYDTVDGVCLLRRAGQK